MRTHVIYIPGLGDRYDGFRRTCLRFWRLGGVSAQLVPSIWYDGKGLNGKIDQIVHEVNNAHEARKRVVLLGESAGGALALQVASRVEVDKVMTLCGVARATTPISRSIRRKAPALDMAVSNLDDLEIAAPIASIRAVIDSVVAKQYSTAKGAKSHIVWSIGHLSTIVLCLTIFAPYVISLAKRP